MWSMLTMAKSVWFVHNLRCLTTTGKNALNRLTNSKKLPEVAALLTICTRMGNSAPSCVSVSSEDLPEDFVYVRELGKGAYGYVLHCVRQDTGQEVALKVPVPLKPDSTVHEAQVLRQLMSRGLEKKNIVRFYEQVPLRKGIGLVMELLDIDLQRFMEFRGLQPLKLTAIRSIIEQMATALFALKQMGLIHADLKPNNIMLVDRVRQPYRVKLVDFGSALLESEAKPGIIRHPLAYRSPELVLGLSFSGSIDMWALGCTLGFLLTGSRLFPGTTVYDCLHFIVDLLGQPPDHLLDHGPRTEVYFEKTDDQRWRLKKPSESLGQSNYLRERQVNAKRFECLDDLKKTSGAAAAAGGGVVQSEDRGKCVDLLKAMLILDPDQRIAPEQVLRHPFVCSPKLQCGPPLGAGWSDSDHSSVTIRSPEEPSGACCGARLFCSRIRDKLCPCCPDLSH